MTISGLQTEALAERIKRFATQRVATSAGQIEFRQAGVAVAVTHVLLHGIGSGSANWLQQFEAADGNTSVRVLAWEAPGYGASAPVSPERPDAGDYAQRLWVWLDAMQVSLPVTLVGHSLGALMAARAATQRPGQIAKLVLLAPAQGYARATSQERQKKLDDRLGALATLGLQGLAQKRAAAMLSPQAGLEKLQYLQSSMAQLHIEGYTQAIHLLAGGDLLTDLAQLSCPVAVASGTADTITAPESCQRVAATAGVQWTDLGHTGHACAVDAAARVNALLGLIAGHDIPDTLKASL